MNECVNEMVKLFLQSRRLFRNEQRLFGLIPDTQLLQLSYLIIVSRTHFRCIASNLSQTTLVTPAVYILVRKDEREGERARASLAQVMPGIRLRTSSLRIQSCV